MAVFRRFLRLFGGAIFALSVVFVSQNAFAYSCVGWLDPGDMCSNTIAYPCAAGCYCPGGSGNHSCAWTTGALASNCAATTGEYSPAQHGGEEVCSYAFRCPNGFQNSENSNNSKAATNCWGQISAGVYRTSGSTMKVYSDSTCTAGYYCPGGNKIYYKGKNQKHNRYLCSTNATSSSGASYCTCKAGYSGGGGTSNPSGSNCVANTYTITLNNNGGSGETKTLYVKYNTGVYLDAGLTQPVTTNTVLIRTKPTKSGFTFNGYSDSALSYTGTTYISSGGIITTDGLNAAIKITSNTTWYAHWNLSCSKGTYYNSSSKQCETCSSGSYCPGVSNVSEGLPISLGKNACPSGYPNSDPGRAAQTSCYYSINGEYSCDDVTDYGSSGTLCSIAGISCDYDKYINPEYTDARRYYNGGMTSDEKDYCKITGIKCMTGYHSEYTTNAGLAYTYKQGWIGSYYDWVEYELNGEIETDGDNSSREHKYDGEWDVYFRSNGGTTNGADYVVRGRSKCSTSSSTAPSESSTDGKYCWCKTTQYKTTDVNQWYPAESPYYYADTLSNTEYCLTECSYICASDTMASKNAPYSNMLSNAKTYICPANTYTVTFNANGGSGAPTKTSETCTYDKECWMANQGTLSKTGYIFNGWNTKSDGTGIHYGGDDDYYDNMTTVNGATITLYAEWVSQSYTVHFDMNGATAKSDITVPFGNSFDIGASAPTRSGWSFGGWQISGMESGITHYSSTNNSAWVNRGTGATLNYNGHVRYWKNLRNTSGTVTFKARWYKICPAGTYFRDSDNTCQPCPSGYYCESNWGYDGEGDSNNKYACPSGFTSDIGARSGGECYKTGTTTCAAAFPVSVAANATSVLYANNGTVPCKYYPEYDNYEGDYTTTQSSCIPDAGVCEVVGMNCNAGYTSVETASPLQDAYSENSYIDYVEFEPDGSVEWNNSNWYREGKANGEWDTWFNYGVVRGRSLCTIDSTSIGDFDGGEWNVTQSSVGQHCWCQTTLYNEEGYNTATWEPAISSWYYAGDMDSNEYCAVECSYRCAVDIIGDNGENFRSDLYDSTVSYECQPSTIHCNAGTYLPQNSTSCTTCPATFYCPGGDYAFNTTSDQGKTACPTPNSSTQRALTADDFDATLNNFAIQPWTTGIQSINGCMANYDYTNSRGALRRESVKYNPNNGKYDNGGSKYYTSINAGYYADTHIRETYCDTPTNSMLYQNALECLNGSYCPGVPSRNAWPLCSSGTYTDTNIIYTCPAGYDGSDNGRNTNTDCYKNCPTITVQHATNVTPVNSKVYYNGSAYPTCTYNVTCDTGYTPSGNGTATPTCTANTYSISYNLNDGSFGTNHPTSATYDVAFTVNNPTHAHATFAGWNITGMDSVTHTYGTATTTDTSIKSTTATNFKNLRATSDESVIFTAKWNCATGYTGNTCGASSYTITYNLNSGTGCSNTTYTFGNTVTLCTPTRDGYIFNGWYDNANLTGTAVATIPTGSTGNKKYWAKWESAKFTLTTSATDSFSFKINAYGNFVVDCGNGGVLSGNGVSGNIIDRTNNTGLGEYTCSWTSSAVQTIRFSGAATGYPSKDAGMAFISAINFNTNLLMSPDNQNVKKITGISGSLGAIFGTIGNGDTYTTQPRFYGTFTGASNMLNTNIDDPNNPGKKYALPPTLFDGISGVPLDYMFEETFMGCSGLTGTIPPNLFADITGAPKRATFIETFRGCSGLTGSIPSKLFENITGPAEEGSFYGTFEGCSGLTGYIPLNIFDNISGGVYTGNWNGAFSRTFYGCNGLQGFANGTSTTNYVPSTFLYDVYNDEDTPSLVVKDMLSGTNIADICPANKYDATPEIFSDAGKPWCALCPDGLTSPAGSTSIDQCVAPLYTITYNLNSGTGCSNTTYTSSDTVTLCTPTRDGYIFNGWYENANLTGTAVATIPTGSTGNKEYWAKWTPNAFSITLNDSGGNGGTGTIYEKYNDGFYSDSELTTSVTSVSVPTRSGYDFIGYYNQDVSVRYIDENGNILATNTTFNDNVILYAQWGSSSSEGDVTFCPRYEDTPAYDPEHYKPISSGGSYPANSYYYYYYAPSGRNNRLAGCQLFYAIDNTLVPHTKEDLSGYTHTMFRSFYNPTTGNYEAGTAIQYSGVPNTVALHCADGYSNKQGSNGMIHYSTLVEARDNACTENTPGGFTPEDSPVEQHCPTEYPEYPEGIKSLTQCYATVSFVTNGGSSVESVNINYSSDKADGYSLSEIPVTTKDNYDFVGWYDNEDMEGEPITIETVFGNGNQVLYANWKETAYTITYELNGGTNYDNAPTEYTIATPTITFGTPTKTNNVFDGWYTEPAFQNQITQITSGSTGNKSLYAKWSQCDACDAGTGASCQLSVVNNVCTYTTTCLAGYDSATIVGNGTKTPSCSPAYIPITLNNQSANTESVPTTVYLKYTEGWYYKDANDQYVALQNNKITSIPQKDEYIFRGYYTATNGSGTNIADDNGMFHTTTPANILTFTTVPTTIYANWELKTYRVTYSCGVSETTPPTDNNDYAKGNSFKTAESSVCTIPNGYASFKNWVVTGNDTGTNYGTKSQNSSTSYAWSENVTLTANFQGNSIKIAYDENGGTSVSDKNCYYGDTGIVLPVDKKAGSIFAGWKTFKKDANNNAIIYSDGDTIDCTYEYLGVYSGNSTNVVAQWTICPGDSYCPGDNTQNLCPTGYTANTSTGKSALSDCKIACPCGTYLASQKATSCTACASGKYKGAHQIGYNQTSQCISAPAGSYVPDSNKCSAVQCATGSYNSSSGKSTCQACSKGYYNTGTGNTSCSINCPNKNSYVKSWTSPSWNSNNTTSNICVIPSSGCYSGTYYNASPAPSPVGQGNCLICPNDTYSTSDGATSCTTCLEGYHTKQDSTNRSDHDSSSDCKIHCYGGSYLPVANASTCTDVGAGYWAPEADIIQGQTNSKNQCTVAGETTCGHGACADDIYDCGRRLHVGSDLVWLKSAQDKTPSIAISVNGKEYYARMSRVAFPMNEGEGDFFKTRYNNKEWYVHDDAGEAKIYDVVFKLTNNVTLEASKNGFLSNDGTYKSAQGTFGLVDNGTWGADYGYGRLLGESSCSTTAGTNYTANPDLVTYRDSVGSNCWCRLTKSDNIRVVLSWVNIVDSNVTSDCARNCARSCSNAAANSTQFRRALFSGVSEEQEQECDSCLPGTGASCELTDNVNCVYSTSCLTGYHGLTGNGTSSPSCTPNTYTVKYNANGGSGSMSDSSYSYGSYYNLSTNNFSRSGYTFAGWALTSSSTTVNYADKAQVINLTSTDGGIVTLYAVWGSNSQTPVETDYDTSINGYRQGSLSHAHGSSSSGTLGLTVDGTWGVDFKYDGSSAPMTRVKGEASCNTTIGIANTANSSVSADVTDVSGPNCWCRSVQIGKVSGSTESNMTSAVSDWVFYGTIKNTTECTKQCAKNCATNMNKTSAFRTAIYGSL